MSMGAILVVGGLIGIAVLVAIVAAIVTVVATAASLQKPDDEE